MNRHQPPPGSRPDCWNDVGVSGSATCPVLKEIIHCVHCDVFAEAGRAFLERPVPEGYAEEWTRALAEPETAREARDRTLVLFRLGEEWLALDVGLIHEVTVAMPVHRVPHRMGGVLRGLVNLRGELHLAVSLHGLLGIEIPPVDPAAPRRMQPRMVVMGRGNRRWAFAVDEMFGARSFPFGAVRSVPATVGRAAKTYTRGLVEWEGRAVGVLDEELLLPALIRSVA